MDVRGPNHNDKTKKKISSVRRERASRRRSTLADKLPPMPNIKREIKYEGEISLEQDFRPTFRVSDFVPSIAERTLSSDTAMSTMSAVSSASTAESSLETLPALEYQFPSCQPQIFADPTLALVPYTGTPFIDSFPHMNTLN
jgi:hypothetical protein